MQPCRDYATADAFIPQSPNKGSFKLTQHDCRQGDAADTVGTVAVGAQLLDQDLGDAGLSVRELEPPLRIHPGRDGDGAASPLWPWPFDASEISALSGKGRDGRKGERKLRLCAACFPPASPKDG